MDIGLHIPDDIAEDMRKTNGQDIARHILEAYVIQAYNNGNWGRRIGQGRRDQELQEVEPPCYASADATACTLSIPGHRRFIRRAHLTCRGARLP
jgi:hypothetical protein